MRTGFLKQRAGIYATYHRQIADLREEQLRSVLNGASSVNVDSRSEGAFRRGNKIEIWSIRM
jgi:hypothetical protein